MPVISNLFDRVISRLRADEGFTMVTVMGVLLVGTMFTVAAVSAADGDILGAGRDGDDKRAFAAAEAGVNDYQFRLDRDNNYWTRCTNVPSPNAVNQRVAGPNGNPSTLARWRSVPGNSGPTGAQYAVELIPANGNATCNESQPEGSMIDATSNTFKVRATGRANGESRSIVATFKRRSFLDYVYFTDYETADPTFLGGGGYATWSAANCVRWWRDGRGTPLYTPSDPDRRCTAINFISGDNIRGPFHTNDEILVCGTPTFGERPEDKVEVSGPPPNVSREGWRPCGAGGTPTFTGAWRPRAPILQLPTSNSQLRDLALPGYRLSGRTEIELLGNQMRINGGAAVPFPANGVVYVDEATNTRCRAYDPDNTYPGYAGYAGYTGDTDCAHVYVWGTYSKDLTIASAKDIIVRNHVDRASGSSAMLGFIANRFVRVWHPVTTQNGNCVNRNDSVSDMRIEAAMLALTNVFVVDNYDCGAPLGTLNVTGAIAQRFRGVVGQFTTQNGVPTPVHGFTKNYRYDRRLQNREPPFFLDPVQASWAVLRQTEQVPAQVRAR